MNAGAPASVQVSQLARDLHRMGPAGRRRLKVAFGRAGQSALSDAKSRASWSSRIPAAISAQTMTGAGSRIGVQLRVSVAQAPHARPYEGMGQGGSFRHPVFGHRERKWADQRTRPYVWPAVRGRIPQITADVNTAFEDAARECGFR